MLESRPVLLGSEYKVTTQLLAPAGQVKVIVDGELRWTITENDYLLVQRASKPLILVQLAMEELFQHFTQQTELGRRQCGPAFAGKSL